MPGWWFRQPPTDPATDYYVDAYRKLETNRQLGYGVQGAIPYTSIVEYAHVHGLRGRVMRLFCDVIYEVDSQLRAWSIEEAREKAGTPDEGDAD